MSWAELDDLLTHLPIESALRTAQRDLFTDEQLADMWSKVSDTDRKHGTWTHQELLTARLIDLLGELVFVQLSRGGVENLDPPEPVRIPGRVNVTPQVSEEDVVWLDDIRERNRRARQETG